ncbi:DNA-3-methyladenine glycosylase 2 family protein [Marinicella sediminis]|nr:AlkA N-terminal domain-containing protein [Marinicella sediminis]
MLIYNEPMTAITDQQQTRLFQQARLARDARFDGRFFTAVKTTGIYCRSICPATPPKEHNVSYFRTATQAAAAGYRPCLRCRPDSAPGSAAWLGSQSVVQRAMRLIQQGWLNDHGLGELASYLGITDRYLRQLFQKNLGTAPKHFAQYHQCLFAKQLIHQTSLAMSEVALASGFNSVRRFNDCFKKMLLVTPSDIRRRSAEAQNSDLRLKLFYRPPYNWTAMHRFLSVRVLKGLEQLSESAYGRSISLNGQQGFFTATHLPTQHAFDVRLDWSDLSQLRTVVNQIRRVLDLESDAEHIRQHLQPLLPIAFQWHEGLRLPGTWSLFEAGVRAILGQQVSVSAACQLTQQLIDELGQKAHGRTYFPEPAVLENRSLDFLRMPGSRKQTLRNLAAHLLRYPDSEPADWASIKGIGPWTIQYTQLRGMGAPDIYLDGDAGVKKALRLFPADFDAQQAAPWRSYLTFQMWQQ